MMVVDEIAATPDRYPICYACYIARPLMPMIIRTLLL